MSQLDRINTSFDFDLIKMKDVLNGLPFFQDESFKRIGEQTMLGKTGVLRIGQNGSVVKKNWFQAFSRGVYEINSCLNFSSFNQKVINQIFKW